MFRSCQRSTCHRPAAATLTFRYDSAEVRLDDLQREAHPQRWELCPTHAARLTVPRGWAFRDERSPEPVAAGELAGVAAHGESAGGPRSRGVPAGGRGERAPRQARTGSPGQSGTGCASGSRYAALQAELPRLAAELARGREWQGADEPGRGDDETEDRGRDRQSGPAGMGALDERSPSAAEPRSSRDLMGFQPGDIPRDPRLPRPHQRGVNP